MPFFLINERFKPSIKKDLTTICLDNNGSSSTDTSTELSVKKFVAPKFTGFESDACLIVIPKLG